MNVHLEQDGILWAINRQIFHPKGFCLGLTEAGNFVLMGDGSETWHFDEALDNRKKVAFDRLLEQAQTQTDSRRPINAKPTNTVEQETDQEISEEGWERKRNKTFAYDHAHKLSEGVRSTYTHQVKRFIIDHVAPDRMVGILNLDENKYFGIVQEIVHDNKTGYCYLVIAPNSLQIDEYGVVHYWEKSLRIADRHIIDILAVEYRGLAQLTAEYKQVEPEPDQEINRALYLKCEQMLMADLPHEVIERFISTYAVGDSVLINTSSDEIYSGKIWDIKKLKGSGYTITLPIDTFCVNRHGDEYYADRPIEIDSEEICDTIRYDEDKPQ